MELYFLDQLFEKHATFRDNERLMDKDQFIKAINDYSQQQVSVEPVVGKPICDTCKKPINNAWDTFEKYKYKTINGNIKEGWCCMDCRLNKFYEEDEAC